MIISKLVRFGLNLEPEPSFGVWNSNDFLTRILYKFRIAFWMILYNFTLLINFSLQFLKLDFISLQTQFLYNFWKLFSLSLQFLKLAFISLQFLKLTFISLQFLFLYDSDATPCYQLIPVLKYVVPLLYCLSNHIFFSLLDVSKNILMTVGMEIGLLVQLQETITSWTK